MTYIVRFILISLLICAAARAQTTQPHVVAPGQISTVSGNGSTMVTTIGPATAGDCVTVDANGNHVDAGGPTTCGIAGSANSGSNFLWLGFPMTGVSFSTVTATVASNVTQTMVTNPSNSGKQMLVEGMVDNVTGTATTYSEFKTHGTNVWSLNPTVAVAANAFSSLSYPPILMPGESFSITTPNSLVITTYAMSYDLGSPFKVIEGYVALSAGSTVVYTVPAKTTAFVTRPNNWIAPFNQSLAFLDVYNFDTTSISYSVSVAGTTMSPSLAAINSSTLGSVLPIPAVLTAGQTVTLNASAANVSGVTGYFMYVWERPN